MNDYRLYALKYGTATEKVFYFRKGTNYPVSLYELVNNIPRPNGDTGNPTTTEKYSAQFLVSSNNLPAQFFVTDAESRLGSNKVWLTSFPTPGQNPVATLIVPRIDITFTNLAGNTPLDSNSNWNGGMRIFPDRLSPTDGTARNVVRVRITTTPAMPNKQVRLKSFDVDDPTPDSLDAGFLIDSNDVNGVKGNDNRGTPQAGTLAQTLLTLDGTGAAETQLTLPMQPGDNLRVAGLFETNNAQMHLDSLQVTNANAALYVTPDTNQIKGFLGGVSPMLTVWRKLHLEIDSMDPVPTTGTEVNFETGTIRRYMNNSPAPGQSTLGLSIDLRGNDNAYENGRIEITNVGTFNVLRSMDVFYNDDVIISATPGTNVIGKGFRIYDDDDRFLSTIGLPPALAKDNESTNIVQGIRPAFLPAYIEVTNANAMNLNLRKRISFKRNIALNSTDIFGDIFADAKDVFDSAGFWAHTLVFGYQPSQSSDGDPNTEHPDPIGVSPEPTAFYQAGVSIVFIELIRESNDSLMEKNISQSALYPFMRTQYTNWISGIAAHEIGHSPGRQSADGDHNEDGLMNASGQQITKFTAPTVRRFRSATSWTD